MGMGGGGGGGERHSVLITSYSFSCRLQEWCYHGQWGVKTPVYNFSSSLFVSVDLKNVSVCVLPPPPTLLQVCKTAVGLVIQVCVHCQVQLADYHACG